MWPASSRWSWRCGTACSPRASTSTSRARTSTGPPARWNCSPTRCRGPSPSGRAGRACPPSASAAPTPTSSWSSRAADAPDAQAEPAEPMPVVPLLLSAHNEAALLAQADQVAAALTGTDRQDLAPTGRTLAVGRAALPHRAPWWSPPPPPKRSTPSPHRPYAAPPWTAAPPSSSPGRAASDSAWARELYAALPRLRPGPGRRVRGARPLAGDTACSSVLFGEDRRRWTGPAARRPPCSPPRSRSSASLESWGVRPDFPRALHQRTGRRTRRRRPLAAGRGAARRGPRPADASAARRRRHARVRPMSGRCCRCSPDARTSSASRRQRPQPPWSCRATRQPSGGRRRTRRAGPQDQAAARQPRLPLPARMDAMLDEFRRSRRASRTPRPPSRSSPPDRAAGWRGGLTTPVLGGAVRRPVRFLDAARVLEAEGVRTYLELGPDGVLSALGPGLPRPHVAPGPDGARRAPEPHTAVTAVAHAHVRGVPVDWPALFGGAPHRPRTCRRTPSNAGATGSPTGPAAATSPRPDSTPRGTRCSGPRVPLADSDGVLFTGRISARSHPGSPTTPSPGLSSSRARPWSSSRASTWAPHSAASG